LFFHFKIYFMAKFDTGRWGMYLFMGIISLILGAAALLMPAISFATLVALFGAYMLANGIFFIVAGVGNRRRTESWGWYIFIGIVSILAGIIAFIDPFAAATAMVYLFGSWMFIAGIATIATAIALRRSIQGEGWYILAGIISIVFSILILLNPVAGAITLATLFGISVFINGVLLISLAIRLKNRDRHQGHHGAIA
jgi:uncharacterized membrane protein HdeD (DUF308 family)